MDYYLPYGAREALEAEIARQPLNVDPHLQLSDWHQEFGDPQEAELRRLVGESVQRRLQNPWSEPKHNPDQGNLIHPNPHGAVDPYVEVTKAFGGFEFWHPHSPEWLGGSGDWGWRLDRNAPRPPLSGDYPDLSTWIDQREARGWDSADLHPAERIYAGIDDLAQSDPALWHLVEQIMRQQHGRGLRFAGGEEPTDYAPSPEDWSRVRLNLGSTAGFDSNQSGPMGNSTYAPNPTVPVLPFPEQGEWDDQLPNDWTTQYASGQPMPKPPVPQYPHEIYPDNRPRPQAPKPPQQHTQSLDPDGMPMSETPGAMGGGSFAPQQTRMQNPGGYNPRQHYPRLAPAPTGPIDSRPATTLQWGTGLLPPGDQSAHPDTPQHVIGDDEGYPEPAWDRYPRANPANPADSPQMSDEDFYNHLIHKGLQDSGPIYDETQRRLYPQKSHQMVQESHWTDEGGYHPSWHPEGGKAPNSRNEQNSPPVAWDWAKPWKFEDDEDPAMYGWDEDRAGFLNEVHQQPFEVTGHQAHADFLQDQLGEQHPDVTFRRHIGDLVDLRTSTPWEDKAGAVSGRGFPYDPSVRGFSPSNIPFHTVGTSSPDSASWLARELRPGLGDDWDARTNPDDWVWRNWGQTYMGAGPFVEGTNGYQSHGNWLTGRGWNPEEDPYGFGASPLTPVELGAYDLENPENIDPVIWPQIEALLRDKWNRHQKFARGGSPTHYADFPTRMITGEAVLPRLRRRKRGGYEYEDDEEALDYAGEQQFAPLFARAYSSIPGFKAVAQLFPKEYYGGWVWNVDEIDPHDEALHGPWEQLPETNELAYCPLSPQHLWGYDLPGGEPPEPQEVDWMHGQDVPPEFKYERTEYADDINTDDYYRRHSLDTNAMVVAADWNDDNSGDPWESQFLREADPWIRDRLGAGWKPPPVGPDGLITDRDYSFTSPILRWPEMSTGWPLTAMHLQPRQHDAAHVPDEHEDPNEWWWGSSPDARLVRDPGEFAEFAGLDPNSPELEWAIRAAQGRVNGDYRDYLRNLTPVEQAYGGITDLANVNPDEWAQIVNLMRQRKRELGRFEDDDEPTEYGPAEDEAGFRQAIDENPEELTTHGAYADWLEEQGDRAGDVGFRRALMDWFPMAAHEHQRARPPRVDGRREWPDDFGREDRWLINEGSHGPGGFRVGPDVLPEGWDWYHGHHMWPTYRAMEDALRHGYLNRHEAAPGTIPGALPEPDAPLPGGELPVELSRYAALPRDGYGHISGVMQPVSDGAFLHGHFGPKQHMKHTAYGDREAPEGDDEPTDYSDHTDADFHAAMDHANGDLTHVGAYADWLEEQGRPRTAARLRRLLEGNGGWYGQFGFDPRTDPAMEPGQFGVAGGTESGPWVRLVQRSASDPSRVFFWGHDYRPSDPFPFPSAHGEVAPLLAEGAVPSATVKHRFIDYLEQYHPDLIRPKSESAAPSEPETYSDTYIPQYAGGMDGTQHPLLYPPCHNPEEPLQYDPMDYGLADDEAGFRQKIEENPYDLNNHLAFADWLEEQGQPDNAQFRKNVAQWIAPRGDSGLENRGDNVRMQWSIPQSWFLPTGVDAAHLPMWQFDPTNEDTTVWRGTPDGGAAYYPNDPVHADERPTPRRLTDNPYLEWETYPNMEDALYIAWLRGRGARI